MEVNLIVEILKFSFSGISTVFVFLALMAVVLVPLVKSIIKYFPLCEGNVFISNSTQELFQKGNFSVVAAVAASIRS